MTKKIDTSILNNIDVGIFRSIPRPEGKFLEVNDALVQMFGYSNKKEFLKHVTPAEIYANPSHRGPLITLLLRKGKVRNNEITLRRKDGAAFFARMTATSVTDKKGKVKWFEGIVEDITSIKEQQERFHHIFQNSPIAIWEEDFSALMKFSKQLRQEGVKDIANYFRRNPHSVIEIFQKIKILDLNKAALDLYGAKTKREVIHHFGKSFIKGSIKVITEEIVALATGQKYFESEFKSKTISGKIYHVLLRVSVPDGYANSLSRVIVTLQDITKRKKLEKNLERMALEDGLTKLLNIRAITRRLEEELIRSKRYNLELSCLMVDIDYFKVVNDKFGHQKGNVVLKRVAQAIRGSVRKSDIIGRYGGDEFLVILPQTDMSNAKVVAARIRKLISVLRLGFMKSANLKLSASVGVSNYPQKQANDYKELINYADKAMYLAKTSGRDCIMTL